MTTPAYLPSGRPLPGEYAAYAQADLDFVVGTDAVVVLSAVATETVALFSPLHDSRIAGVRYAPDKWTLKDILGHLVDDERIMSYRALCLARGETLPLAGFDEKVYTAHAGAEARPLADLLAEYRAVREASLALFRSLTLEAWVRPGVANGLPVTPRGLAFHIAAHELHHLRIVREKYLPLVR